MNNRRIVKAKHPPLPPISENKPISEPFTQDVFAYVRQLETQNEALRSMLERQREHLQLFVYERNELLVRQHTLEVELEASNQKVDYLELINEQIKSENNELADRVNRLSLTLDEIEIAKSEFMAWKSRMFKPVKVPAAQFNAEIKKRDELK